MPRTERNESLIHGLPVELLSSVFYWASFIESSSTIQRIPSRGIVSNHAPLTLVLKGCRRWRSIALNTPALFTQLYILETFPVDIVTIVPLWLERSKSLPLKIWLNLQDVKENCKPPGFESVILQIRKHMDRIIFLISSFSYHLSLLFPGSANNTICLPALKHLGIASAQEGRHGNINIGFISAPCLTTVVLASNSTRFSQLYFGGQLTRFLCHQEGSLTCMQFYELLARNTNLVECSVLTTERRQMWTVASDSEKRLETCPMLELPNLTNLSITWATDLYYLTIVVNRLRTPCLEYLQLHPKRFYFRQDGSQSFFKAISACVLGASKLTRLHIGFGSSSLKNTVPLSDMFSCIPSLKDLTFEGGSFSPWENLLNDLKTLPLLERLHFHGCSLDLDDTLCMVKSRAGMPEVEGIYRSLKEFFVTGVWWVVNGEHVERDISLDRLRRELAISCPNLAVIAS